MLLNFGKIALILHFSCHRKTRKVLNLEVLNLSSKLEEIWKDKNWKDKNWKDKGYTTVLLTLNRHFGINRHFAKNYKNRGVC